jgi:hypothetical protein
MWFALQTTQNPADLPHFEGGNSDLSVINQKTQPPVLTKRAFKRISTPSEPM